MRAPPSYFLAAARTAKLVCLCAGFEALVLSLLHGVMLIRLCGGKLFYRAESALLVLSGNDTSLVMWNFHLVCVGPLFCCVGNRQFVCVGGSAVGGYALKKVRLTGKRGWSVCIIAYNGNEHGRRSGGSLSRRPRLRSCQPGAALFRNISFSYLGGRG